MKLYVRKAMPVVLSLLSTAGLVTTAVLSGKATLKAEKLLAQSNERNITMTHMEVIKTVAPVYVPAMVTGAATVLCIVGIGTFGIRSSASMASAYALLDSSYRQYRSAAKEAYGEDADAKIKAIAAKKTYVSSDGYNLYYPDKDRTGDIVLFYDDYSQRYFNATMAAVLNAQYHVNRNLALRGDSCLNEFYQFLGLEDIEHGYDLGWCLHKLYEDGISWLDFDNRHVLLEDGMECYILTTMVSPSTIDDE